MKDALQEAINHGIQEHDTDNDGILNLENFTALIKELNQNYTDSFAKLWFKGIDVEGKGYLTVETVKNLFQVMVDNWEDIEQSKYPIELLRTYFRAMDKNRDRKINLQEMQDFLLTTDSTMTTHSAAVRVRKLDKNYDGLVEFWEYCQAYGVQVPKRTDAYSDHIPSECCILV